MRPVKQQFRHDPDNGVYGDCHRAAIATVLGLPIEHVPHFNEDNPSDDVFADREAAFLALVGLRSVQLPFDCGYKLDAILAMVERLNGDVVYLLGGKSRTGVNHTVVCRGAAIVHDPSQTDAGIVGPCSDGFYWLTFFQPTNLEWHAHTAKSARMMVHEERGDTAVVTIAGSSIAVPASGGDITMTFAPVEIGKGGEHGA